MIFPVAFLAFFVVVPSVPCFFFFIRNEGKSEKNIPATNVKDYIKPLHVAGVIEPAFFFFLVCDFAFFL